MVLFVGKDPSLTPSVVSGLLRYWPCGDYQKELLFLQEMEELFEHLREADITAELMARLTHRLAILLAAPHFQLAERVLWYWGNDAFLNKVVRVPARCLAMQPTLLPILQKNHETHWN